MDRLAPSDSKRKAKTIWRASRPLVSWTGRCHVGLNPETLAQEHMDANEAEIRLEFESVGQQLTQSLRPIDKWQWYFLMQHYGAPTRLLDWTINPLAALYFAVRDEFKRDAAVWVIDPWRWNHAHIKDLYGPAVAGWKETQKYLLDVENAFDTENDEKQTKEKWPVAIEPPHIDRRIAAQGSNFVLFGREKNMVESPAINNPKGGKTKHAILDKIVIPKSSIHVLREELTQIGINDSTMFPDLGGLGRHIAWEWQEVKYPKRKT